MLNLIYRSQTKKDTVKLKVSLHLLLPLHFQQNSYKRFYTISIVSCIWRGSCAISSPTQTREKHLKTPESQKTCEIAMAQKLPLIQQPDNCQDLTWKTRMFSHMIKPKLIPIKPGVTKWTVKPFEYLSQATVPPSPQLLNECRPSPPAIQRLMALGALSP